MPRIKLELNKEDFKKKLGITNGKDGKTPTKKELISIIKPLIPEPKKEVIIEKTIVEKPTITNIENPLTGVEIVDKINDLPIYKEHQIDAKHIKNLDRAVNVIQRVGGGGGMSEVIHDTSLTGKGTEESPLGTLFDISDYAKLAISTTQDNLYTNLIPNALLIPNQWYLITDYVNVTPIAGTTNVQNAFEYHSGLVDKWRNEGGGATQLYYDDGVTPIVDGDPEELYVLAASTNTISIDARSKTFSKEKVSFKQTIANSNKNVVMIFSGAIPTDFYMYGQGDDAGGITNGEPNITIDSIISATQIRLGGTYVEAFAERDTNLGYFYLNFYNTDLGVDLYLTDGNENSDWSYNPTTKILTDLTGTIDFTYFTSSSNSFDGYLQWQDIYTGSTVGKINNSREITLDTILDDSRIVLGGDIYLYGSKLPGFYASFGNDVTGNYIEFDESTEGVDWDFDPLTNIFTNLQNNYVFDFRQLTSDYCYGDMSFFAIDKTFQGRIIGRNNLECNIIANNDWRSTLQKRYKTSAPTWSSGTTYTADSYVKYGGIIYRAYKESTGQLPTASQSYYWQRLTFDNYYFAANLIPSRLDINTADYIYTPIFDTGLLRTAPGLCNLTLGTRTNTELCDMVLYGLVTNYTNFSASGKQLTFIGQSTNSSIKGENAIVGRLDDSSFLSVYASFVSSASASINGYIYLSIIGSITSSSTYFITSSYIERIDQSIVYYFSAVTSTKTLSTSTLFNIQDTFFNAGCVGSTVSTITNSNFLYTDIAKSFASNVFSGIVTKLSVLEDCYNNQINGGVNCVNIKKLYKNVVSGSMEGINVEGSNFFIGTYIPLQIYESKFTNLQTVKGTTTSAQLAYIIADSTCQNIDFRNGGTTLIGSSFFARGFSNLILATTGNVFFGNSNVYKMFATTIATGTYNDNNIQVPFAAGSTFPASFSNQTLIGSSINNYFNIAADGTISYIGTAHEIKRYRDVPSATTITAGDYLLRFTGTYTQALPTAVGIGGQVYQLKNKGTGTITIDPSGTQTIDRDLTRVLNPGDNLTIISNNVDWDEI